MATYYVRKDGNDATGDGSTGNPWLTLNKALSVITSGDTVNFGDGIYQEDNEGMGYCWINARHYASTVTFQAEKGAAGDVTLQGLTSTSLNVRVNNSEHITFKWIKFVSRVYTQDDAFDLRNSNLSYIQFDDCTFTALSDPGHANSAFYGTQSAGFTWSHITLNRCTFNQIGADLCDGLRLSRGAADDVIDAVTVIDCVSTVTRFAIFMRGVTNLYMQNCSGSSSGALGVAGYIGDDADSCIYTTSGLIENCIFSSVSSHSFLIGAGCEDLVATNCTVYGGDYGIVIKQNINTDVEYCTVFGGSVSGIYCKAAIDPIVKHNHITNYRGSLFKVGKGTVDKCSGVIFEHNMLIATGSAGCLEWTDDTGDAGGGVCDYNKYGPRGSGLLGSVRADASVANLAELHAAWADYGDSSNDSHSALIQGKSSLLFLKR